MLVRGDAHSENFNSVFSTMQEVSDPAQKTKKKYISVTENGLKVTAKKEAGNLTPIKLAYRIKDIVVDEFKDRPINTEDISKLETIKSGLEQIKKNSEITGVRAGVYWLYMKVFSVFSNDVCETDINAERNKEIDEQKKIINGIELEIAYSIIEQHESKSTAIYDLEKIVAARENDLKEINLEILKMRDELKIKLELDPQNLDPQNAELKKAIEEKIVLQVALEKEQAKDKYKLGTLREEFGRAEKEIKQEFTNLGMNWEDLLDGNKAAKALNKILLNYTVRNGFLFNNHDQKFTGIKKDLLENVLKQAFKHLPSYEKDKTHVQYNVGNRKFVILKEGENVQLSFLSKLLGQGGFGTVYESLDLTTGNVEAYKQAGGALKKPAMVEIARRDLENEHKLLKLLSEGFDGHPWGLQEAGREVAYVSGQLKDEGVSELSRVGIFMPRYESDYHEILLNRIQELSRNENVEKHKKDTYIEVHQLLHGLKLISEKQIIHGDIKPENILFKTHPKSGLPLAVVSDLGGAKLFDEKEIDRLLLKNEDFQSTAFTTSYVTRDDFSEQRKIINEINDLKKAGENPTEAIKQLKQLYEKRDVFAMGCVLFKAFNFRHPYKIESQGELKGFLSSAMILEKFRGGVPLEMQELITEMLSNDREKRPSIQEVVSRFDAFLKADNPELFDEIEKQMQAYQTAR